MSWLFLIRWAPKGKARIRTQVSAGHTKDDIDYIVKCFKEVRDEVKGDAQVKGESGSPAGNQTRLSLRWAHPGGRAASRKRRIWVVYLELCFGKR